MLRELFPHGRFHPPASNAQIAAVEASLGVRLPEPLRRLYLEADGFREDRGNAKYLLSLTEPDTIGSLVSTTRFYWDEWPGIQPGLELRDYLFFGYSGGDEVWGIHWRPPEEIIVYHPQMGSSFETAGTDLLRLFRDDYAAYDLLAEPDAADG
ncbi:MAG: SMI1/KNR4 family protein [Armatimonadota bacterium]